MRLLSTRLGLLSDTALHVFTKMEALPFQMTYLSSSESDFHAPNTSSDILSDVTGARMVFQSFHSFQPNSDADTQSTASPISIPVMHYYSHLQSPSGPQAESQSIFDFLLAKCSLISTNEIWKTQCQLSHKSVPVSERTYFPYLPAFRRVSNIQQGLGTATPSNLTGRSALLLLGPVH